MLVLASELGKHDMYKSGHLQKLDGDASCLAVQLQLLTVAEMFVEDAMEDTLSSVLLGRGGVSKPSSRHDWMATINKCLLTSLDFSHQLL